MAFLSLVVRCREEQQPVCQSPRGHASPRHARINAVTHPFSDGAPRRPVALWRRGIIACFAGAASVFAHAPHALAQPALPSLEAPGADASIAAFNAVRARLVDAAPGDDDAAPGDDAGALPLPDVAHGANVVLRLDGRIIARGQAFGVGSLQRAVEAAAVDLDRQLPPGVDVASQAERAKELARAGLSLELAGPPIPVRVGTFAEADVSLQPGLDGVGVRRGERVEVVFPATGMVFGRLPGDMLSSAIAELLGDATAPLRNTPSGELGPLAEAKGLEVFRFRVTHLVQHAGGDTPGFMHRGARLSRPVSLVEMRSLERSLAEHLAGRLRRVGAREVLIGTHHAGTGRDQPEIATRTDQAVACLALVAHARGAPPVEALPSIAVARDVLRSLAHEWKGDEALGEGPLWDDPGACAAWLLAARALIDVPGEAAPADPDEIERIDGAVVRAFAPDTGWAPGVAEQSRGLIACALASRAADARNDDAPAARALANAAVRSLFRETQAQRWVVHMPWLARAELLLAGDAPQVPAASALREFRDLVWSHQLRNIADPDNADFEGGVVFTGSGNPYPTWQSAGALASAAVIAGDARLVDDREEMAQVLRLAAGVRFLRRLVIDADGAWLAADRRRALGGVRVAPWDPRLPLDATSMALLATSNARGAIEAIGARRAARAQAAPKAP
ncbi:MAG: hypothetical protein SFY69_04625 [Planctomycetota bacterium]|nr:hypothetical protein [Planctomycetota bacterium]